MPLNNPLRPAIRAPMRQALAPAMRTIPDPAQAHTAHGLIAMASDLANRAHMGQVRKGNGLPYIIHPYRVATLVQGADGTPEQVAAAWCHDVLEDCPDYRDEAKRLLPPHVYALVSQLTKPEISPGKRVKGEHFYEHLRAISGEACRIKLADRIDNLREADTCMPHDWLVSYLEESEHVLAICARGSDYLAGTLRFLISDMKDDHAA